ncbi:hypothetical protein QO034_18645 [Sedimentitalea sp. JM2-8]|uniref:TLP18.3, Psb32 and MOLO-1 founding protein of phosphatase n=1 Tax=Sedimentitalea xiamensis TaxID=3050037 RepID=A0ABT7FJ20_9RHOB|nr:hypothetical protein [Sedimentitalea xiamensis]MDK3075111.1 hypothetical protein [Sedimentitalea xiamensis]
MVENEIAQSEHMVSSIVSKLAARGVRRTELTLSELGYENNEENTDLFIDAVKWLESEGIIRSGEKYDFYANSKNETVASGFTVTSFGFALLQQPFDGNLTLGAAIEKVRSDGSGYSKIGDLVGGLLGGFTKTISN